MSKVPISGSTNGSISDAISQSLTNFNYTALVSYSKNWTVWLLVLVFIVFVLWLIFGGKEYEYIGLSPMKLGVDSTKYVNDHTRAVVERSNYRAKKITGKDLSKEKEDDPSPCFVPSSNSMTTPYPTPEEKPVSCKRVSKGEQICREVMEEIYGAEFPCVRPEFLRNPETNRKLELDCYNEDLKIAVEYNGIQHYTWPNFTGQSKENFIKQLRRDKYKVKTCDDNGVYLITVPYTVPHDKIRDYIIQHLPDSNICSIQPIESIHPDSFDDTDDSDNLITEVSESYDDKMSVSFIYDD